MREFIEKPGPDQKVDTNLISAGAYVLEREILALVPPDRNVSIEREIWPQLVGNGLFGFPSGSYWMDIGTPERYLKGTFDIIEGNVKTAVQARLGESGSRSSRTPRCSARDPAGVLDSGVRWRPAHRSAAWWCSAGTFRSAREHRRACRRPGRQRDRRPLRAARLHRGPGLPDRRRHPVTGGAVLGEGVALGADN